MKSRVISPLTEGIIFKVLAIGCSIWILKYDIILLIPILGLVASVRELNVLKKVENKA
jgi:hypothetical protein